MELKFGCSRIVLLIGNYAIKFPKPYFKYPSWGNFITGLYANLSEEDCWKNNCFDGYQIQTLCPVKFCFYGFFLVMPRVKTCQSEEELKGLPEYEGEDRHASNYGYYMGRIVCIDYPYHLIKPIGKK